ncbi:Hypothetical predicted protein [Lecanosticta acicola]|uniref:Uncharacterized protein n=1 Tax=Lecanosticta acicola TaxID=111012 RepID=A0AAI8Z4R5_9PEZI|nr:Hypothetical predicted protein [Lecanosticta acicola]
MERSLSSASAYSETTCDHMAPGSMAPWERREMGQVPYISPESAPQTQAESRAVHCLRAAQDKKAKASGLGRPDSYGRPPHPAKDDSGHRQWTAQDKASSSRGPRTAPELARPPVSESGSWSSSSAPSSAKSSPSFDCEPHDKPIKALPGTMSARNGSATRTKIAGSQSPEPIEEQTKETTPTFGKKFKTALRGAFRRSPVDDSGLRRVGSRHWTETEEEEDELFA